MHEAKKKKKNYSQVTEYTVQFQLSFRKERSVRRGSVGCLEQLVKYLKDLSRRAGVHADGRHRGSRTF